MAIGKISGPMLQTNLERQGVDLSIDGNVAYFDVTNRRLGVNTVPTATLDVNGNAKIANFSFAANTITSTTGVINLGSISNVTISGGSSNYVMATNGAGILRWAQISDLDFTFGNLEFVDTTIHVTKLNSNLYLAANGSGVINANGTLVSNVAVPVNSSDAATKGYVDTTLLAFNDDRIVSGNTVVLATASNVTVSVSGSQIASYTATNANISNIKITGSSISSLTSDLQLAGRILSNKIVFGSNSSVTLPAGDNAARPAVPSAGDFRYNTTTNSIEFYNGSDWLGTSVNIDSQVINGDGTNQSFTLSHATTTNGILVSINGTLQQPTLAYTVSGNVITFVEIPMSTDVIEVRYIALTVTPSVNVNSVDSANVAVNTTTTIIDSFSSSQYGSAKYTISATDSNSRQIYNVVLTQFGGTSSLATVANVRTGASYITFTSNVSGSTVNLIAQASTSLAQIKIQKTYFTI